MNVRFRNPETGSWVTGYLVREEWERAEHVVVLRYRDRQVRVAGQETELSPLAEIHVGGE